MTILSVETYRVVIRRKTMTEFIKKPTSLINTIVFSNSIHQLKLSWGKNGGIFCVEG